MPEVVKSRSGVERAAILLLTLGESEAAEILKHMGAKDVQRLGRSMAELTSVSRDEVRDVLSTLAHPLLPSRPNSVLVKPRDARRAAVSPFCAARPG